MENVTVLITVGPEQVYLDNLPNAIASVLEQTYPVNEILIIGDGFDVWSRVRLDTLMFPGLYIGELGLNRSLKYGNTLFKKMWIESEEKQSPILSTSYTPWNIGFAQTFNCGVGLSKNELVMYLSADDRFLPTAVEDCVAAWEKNEKKDAWYACSYVGYPSGNVGTIPNNLAMITKNLWGWLGGFPPCGFAGPDALLMSIMLVHAPERIIKVCEGKANYIILEHDNQETHRQASYFLDEMNAIRDKQTRRFQPKEGYVLK